MSPDSTAQDDEAGRMTAPRTVLLFSRIDFAWLNPIVMARLRERFGTRFVLMVGNETWRRHYEPHLGPGDKIHQLDVLEQDMAAGPLDEAAAFDRARANEARYGLTYMRDVVQQARSVSAYYLNYAPFSPFTRMAQVPFPELIKRINGYFDWFDELLAAEAIDLVIERPGDLASTACLHAAMARGIATTFWLPARYKSFVMWSYGPYLGHTLLRRAFEAQPDLPPIPPEELQPPDDSKRNFDRAAELRSVRMLARNVYAATRDRIIWLAQDLVRRQRSKRLGYLAVIRHHHATWRLHRHLQELIERDMTRLTARPFVLFLLQFEPEYTTLSLSRQFNDTRAIVKQLALAMPAGHDLVVKENVNSIGNRGVEFYDEIARLPNVVLADHAIRGIDLAARAAAVATVSSTGAIEANLLGKPAIIFAPHVEYGFLPAIHTVTGFRDLPDVVRAAVRPRTPEEADAIRRSGARYRAALRSLSFDAPGTRPFRGTETTIADDQADRAVDLLIETYRAQRNGGDESDAGRIEDVGGPAAVAAK